MGFFTHSLSTLLATSEREGHHYRTAADDEDRLNFTPESEMDTTDNVMIVGQKEEMELLMLNAAAIWKSTVNTGNENESCSKDTP